MLELDSLIRRKFTNLYWYIVIVIDNASCLTIIRRCCHVTVRVPHLLLRVLLDPPDQAGDPRVDPGVVRAGAPRPEADDAQLGVPETETLFTGKC